VHLEAIDLKVGYTLNKHFSIQEDDPLSATETITQRATLARGAWQVALTLSMTLTADAGEFRVSGHLQAEENGREMSARDWDVSVPRQLV